MGVKGVEFAQFIGGHSSPKAGPNIRGTFGAARIIVLVRQLHGDV